jgi:hypothetical protein
VAAASGDLFFRGACGNRDRDRGAGGGADRAAPEWRSVAGVRDIDRVCRAGRDIQRDYAGRLYVRVAQAGERFVAGYVRAPWPVYLFAGAAAWLALFWLL